MKKLLTGMFLIFIMINDSEAQSVGIQAGVNLSTMLEKDYNYLYSVDYKMNTGFHGGTTAEFSLTRRIAIETAGLLTLKGHKLTWMETNQGELIKNEETLILYYVQAPVSAKLYFSTGNVKPYITFGPYIGIGLTGKRKTSVNDSEYETEEINWGPDPLTDDYGRTDYGFTAGTGIMIKSFQAGLSYNYGLANISPISDYGYRSNHRILKIFLGIRIINNDKQVP